MAEYLIQSETLDNIANAINAKTGKSAAMTPVEMATEIESIETGGGADYLAQLLTKTITHYESADVTVIGDRIFDGCAQLRSFWLPNVYRIGDFVFRNCTSLQVAVFPKLDWAIANRPFQGTSITAIDVRTLNLSYEGLAQTANLNTIIIRNPTQLARYASANAFDGTPFASGGTGGTIYIPKVLYDHLGDGTSLDYKAATNWSTLDSYGTITWAQIEDSIYETQYADGTPIPSE